MSLLDRTIASLRNFILRSSSEGKGKPRSLEASLYLRILYLESEYLLIDENFRLRQVDLERSGDLIELSNELKRRLRPLKRRIEIASGESSRYYSLEEAVDAFERDARALVSCYSRSGPQREAQITSRCYLCADLLQDGDIDTTAEGVAYRPLRICHPCASRRLSEVQGIDLDTSLFGLSSTVGLISSDAIQSYKYTAHDKMDTSKRAPSVLYSSRLLLALGVLSGMIAGFFSQRFLPAPVRASIENKAEKVNQSPQRETSNLARGAAAPVDGVNITAKRATKDRKVMRDHS